MTSQQEQAVLEAVEDTLILSLPDSVPLPRRVELVLACRREVARVLKTEPDIPTPLATVQAAGRNFRAALIDQLTADSNQPPETE